MEFLGEVAKSCKDASLEKLGFCGPRGAKKQLKWRKFYCLLT